MNTNNNSQRTQIRNIIAGSFFIFFGAILIILLIADIVMWIAKGEIAPLFEHLTEILFGAFIGMITTVIAFYFGEPKTDVSTETLRTILNEMEEHERTSTNEQSAEEDT